MKKLSTYSCFWSNQSEKPMLWQGKYSVWMDAIEGKRCGAPIDGEPIESLARRLKSLLEFSD